jgi:Glycosyl transferases group 1
MHCAVAMAGLPAPGNHGGALTCWGIVRGLRDAGHRVSVVSLFDRRASNPYLADEDQNQRALAALGVGLETIEFGAELFDRAIAPHWRRTARHALSLLGAVDAATLDALYPFGRLRPAVTEALERLAPEVVFCYHFEPLAATVGYTGPARMAGVGDPLHLPIRAAWQSARPTLTAGYARRTIAMLYAARVYPPLMITMLRECRAVGAFAAHYASWLRTRGLPAAAYLRTPLVDPVGDDWQRTRDTHAIGSKLRVLLIGDLAGTATITGLDLLARQTLPRLEELLGPDGFELRLVGRGEPPSALARLLDRPSVRMVGPVEPADAEFLSCDVLLVPTPVTLGIRVRILMGLAYGCCIVAHRANTAGIPELVHGENCLLPSTGVGLAEEAARVGLDEALRRGLQVGARGTYERFFSTVAAASPIVRKLEELAAARGAQGPQ